MPRDAVELLRRAALMLGGDVVLWVRFPDGTRKKARPVLRDWMGGTDQRPWPDVELVGADTSQGATPTEGRRRAKELHIVVENVAEPGAVPEWRFIEIEDETGSSVTFPMMAPDDEIASTYRHIVIPYGHDEEWLREVVYQAAGAATRPLLEDHPDYVFPSERVRDAVGDLLRDFGIEPRFEGELEAEAFDRGRAAADPTLASEPQDDAPAGDGEGPQDGPLSGSVEVRIGPDGYPWIGILDLIGLLEKLGCAAYRDGEAAEPGPEEADLARLMVEPHDPRTPEGAFLVDNPFAAEAKRLLATAVPADKRDDHVLLRAGAHATLALAFEQRQTRYDLYSGLENHAQQTGSV